MTPSALLLALCLLSPLCLTGVAEGWGGFTKTPTESECRPFIEKALKEQQPADNPQEAVDATSSEQLTTPQSVQQEGSIEETEEATTKESIEGGASNETQPGDEGGSVDTETTETTESVEDGLKDNAARSEEGSLGEEAADSIEAGVEETGPESTEEPVDQPSVEDGGESAEKGESIEPTSTEAVDATSAEQSAEAPDDSTKEASEEDAKSLEDNASLEQEVESVLETEEAREVGSEDGATATELVNEKPEETEETAEESAEKSDISREALSEDQAGEESIETPIGEEVDSVETTESAELKEPEEATEDTNETVEENKESAEETKESEDAKESVDDTKESIEYTKESIEDTKESIEDTKESIEDTKESIEDTKESIEDTKETVEDTKISLEDAKESTEESKEALAEEPTEEKESAEESDKTETSGDASTETVESSAEASSETKEESSVEAEVSNDTLAATPASGEESIEQAATESTESGEEEKSAEEEPVKESEPTDEDQLTLEFETPKVRRPRDHITDILRLSPEAAETETLLAKTIDSTLKDLKRLYDAAIKPLELLFKYRDLSNRHFGDPEIFSKPLILFMGPWSGGKSSIINYLLDNEFKTSSLRTGAEPSPAYFNILMWGEREEVLDGTQLAADWTFSGLQKFGQGLLDRLRGLRLNSPLLEKVNIVEIPGILEIRKQVERLFPFNDACQWFIDRADIIFLVYDPSKLDVGPETEAILDQLKGREYQTRIILNKADQVRPEELMRVQGTLIWNISPLMSSTEPPVMYSTSLWSVPYEQGAPSRLLHAQERAFLRDLRLAVDRRVENKIASARRFAVRVRNHAKMVDCYLTTYYNHKTFFGNRKKVADDITEHPQNYHIYEGLSTLTNISRYDLPDPEVYRDFFRLNAVYDFQRLSETCTYFRGCPINRLDVAIAYDLPELVGKYKKQAEKVLEAAEKQKGSS